MTNIANQWQNGNQSTVVMTSATEDASIAFQVADFPVYRLKLFANLVLATGANSLAFVLILWASPKQIQIYRWFLLDILLSAFCMDLYFLALLQPYPLMPLPGFCALGAMKVGGTFFGGFIGVTIMFFLLGCCAASVLSAAFYRLLAIYNRQTLMLSPVGIAATVGLHLFITVPVQVAAGFVIAASQDQQPIIRAQIHEQYPGLRQLLNSSEVCVFAPVNSIYGCGLRTGAIVAIVILSLVGLFGVSIVGIGFVSLLRRRSTMSSRLFLMHRQLSLSLFFQLIVPGLTLYMPFCVIALSVFYQLKIKVLADLYAGLFSLHSTMSAVMLVAFTRPYRQAVLRRLLGHRWIQWIQRSNPTSDQRARSQQMLATEIARRKTNGIHGQQPKLPSQKDRIFRLKQVTVQLKRITY